MIHIIRDPVDTCLSCFATLFSRDQPFAFDLGELGRYHACYEAVMAHWRTVLPQDWMLEVRYEDVVTDFEPQARRILAHCGLAWTDAVLQFHKADRPVRTASVRQVRQPLYRSSLRCWRPNDEHLQPLLDGLALLRPQSAR